MGLSLGTFADVRLDKTGRAILEQVVARKTVCMRRLGGNRGASCRPGGSSPIRRACPAKPEVTAAKLAAGYFHAIHRGRQLGMEQQ